MLEGNKKYSVFAIIERPGYQKAFFRKLGAAFVNNDGSVNVYLDAVPTNGKLHIREELERTDEAGLKPWANGNGNGHARREAAVPAES